MAILQAHDQQTSSVTGERPSALIPLAEGVAGIRATLSAMVKMTKIYRNTTPIRDVAERIIAGVREKDYWAEAAAVHAWARDSIRYTRDVYDVETLKTPLETLRSMQGDCDDKSLLAGTILQTIGFPVRYVAISSDTPGAYDHVFAEAKIGEHWVGVETTEPVALGWRPPRSLMAPMIQHV